MDPRGGGKVDDLSREHDPSRAGGGEKYDLSKKYDLSRACKIRPLGWDGAENNLCSRTGIWSPGTVHSFGGEKFFCKKAAATGVALHHFTIGARVSARHTLLSKAEFEKCDSQTTRKDCFERCVPLRTRWNSIPMLPVTVKPLPHQNCICLYAL